MQVYPESCSTLVITTGHARSRIMIATQTERPELGDRGAPTLPRRQAGTVHLDKIEAATLLRAQTLDED